MSQGSARGASHEHVEADISDLAHGDAAAIHDNVAAEINALTGVTTASGDYLLIEDSAATNAKKSATVSALLGAMPLDSLSDVSAHTPTKANLLAADGTEWDAVTVGTNDDTLVASSAAAQGVAWGTPGGAGNIVKIQGYTGTGVDVGSTTPQTVVTYDATSIAAGDLLVAEVWGYFENNSGTGRTLDHIVDFDGAFAPTQLQTSHTASGGAQYAFYIRWALQVVSSSDAFLYATVWQTETASTSTFADYTMEDTADTTTSDLTGTVTVSLTQDVSASTTGATVFPTLFVVRHYTT